MLVLSRKRGEEIRIGDEITVTVVRIQGNSIRLAIDAPKQVRVLRGELIPAGESNGPGQKSTNPVLAGDDNQSRQSDRSDDRDRQAVAAAVELHHRRTGTDPSLRQRLELHPQFRSRSSSIDIQWEDGVLVLSGKLPSFYLRQLCQDLLEEVTPRIHNDIQVVSSHGCSSVSPSP